MDAFEEDRWMQLAPDGVELVDDLSAARWVEERLRRWPWAHVGSVVPEGFPAYARLFHPAYCHTESGPPRVRWSTVASWTGRVVHPLMQFPRIANLTEPYETPRWGNAPLNGSLEDEECRALVGVLRAFTARADRCWFCVWAGYAFLSTERHQAAPRLRMPNRDYLLFRGSLDTVRSFLNWPWQQSPNIWWPDDRAWCVATEIDLYDTYVGGSTACVERILRHPELEALPATLEARVDFDADTINI